MIDIRIDYQTDRTPIYTLGRIEPIRYDTGRRHPIISIEVTEEDGNGRIIMSNELQLYRLYEKLREYYHPEFVTIGRTMPNINNPYNPYVPMTQEQMDLYNEIFTATTEIQPLNFLQTMLDSVSNDIHPEQELEENQETVLQFMEKE